MIDWYYHDPSEGRVGPYSAEELRKRYADRRIQHDTLVWNQSMREWQPLQRMAEELGLDQVRRDPSAPPPLPPSNPRALHATTTASRTHSAVGKYSRVPLHARKKLPGAAIIAIALAGVAFLGVVIVASIALPAYRDYAMRADNVGAVTGIAAPLKRNVAEYAVRTGRCPDSRDPHVAKVAQDIRSVAPVDVRFATIEDGCMFELALNADGKPIDGRTLRYEGFAHDGDFVWDCSGGDLPQEYRPYECRRE